MSESIVFTEIMSRKDDLQAAQVKGFTPKIRMTKEFLEAHVDQNLVNDVLYLDGQGFRFIENLDSFCWITCLWLNDNAISSFAGLEGLPCLTTLSLENNRLTSLVGAHHLKSLVSLDVSGNLISNIDHLRSLPRLTTLYMSHNNLSASRDIFHLILCPHLECVDLSYNRLEGVGILKVMSCMDHLLVLRLEGNAVTRLPWYRKRVIASCRKLSFLDMEAIRRLERYKVEEWCNSADAADAEAVRYWTQTNPLHDAKGGKLQVGHTSAMLPVPRAEDANLNYGGARPKVRNPPRTIREESVTRSIQGHGFCKRKSTKETGQRKDEGDSIKKERGQDMKGSRPVAKFVSSLWRGLKYRYSTKIDRAVE